VNEQPQSEKAKGVGREKMRARVKLLRDSRKYSMLGAPELVGLAASGIILLAVVISYFYFLTPAQARLKSIQNEYDRLRTRISAAQQGVDQNASPQATVDEINQSLEKFESGALLVRSQGRLNLYANLNEMLRRHKLRNTAGPVYSPLEPLGGPGAPSTAAQAGNARWQSLYPGISISVTVEGPYADLSRFLSEVESSRHFIVINAVEFEGVSDANSQGGATLVSLRLEMSTYFQREGASTDATP
jgi:Tfp pilus assembly protein PilO